MRIGDSFIALLFWTLVLLALSWRMLRARPENQPKYNEVIGCLILAAILTTVITAIS